MEAIDPVVLQRLVDDLAAENQQLRERINTLECQLDDALCNNGPVGECAS